MEFIKDVFNQLGMWTDNNMSHIVGAMTASLLMIYGDSVIALVKRNTRQYHFLIRVGIFVVVCSLGFVLLDSAITGAIGAVIRQFTTKIFLFPVMFSGFILIGIIAERKRQM